MAYFMGIDVGTSSVKALIMDGEGTEIGSASRKYDVLKPQMNYAEQDPEEIWEAVKGTLLELSKRYPKETEKLKGISYSGQMHGLVLVDAFGKPVCNMIIWQDHRSVDQREKIYSLVPFEEFNRVTLNQLSPGYLVMSLMWVKEHAKEIYDRSALFLLPKDYIRYRMCGTLGTDMSDASATVIFDTAKKCWPWEVVERLGLRKELFPECHESTETAGTVTKACAKECGLPAGVPVLYGGGDTLMHEIGTGMIDEGRPWVSNIGTACQVTCVMKRPVYDEQFRTNTFCCVKEDLWMLMAVGMCGGSAMKWMQGILGVSAFEELNRMAEQVRPGSDGVVFLPYLSGTRCPENDPLSKGIYFGLSLDHGREHLVRSTMEGVVYSLRSDLDLLETLTGKKPETMIASGGGARGRLFLQMQADIFQKPIYTTESAEQSCLGAAMTAAVGTGHFSSFEEACGKAVRFRDEVVEPITENSRRYEEYYQVYRNLYGCNKELFWRLPL